MIYRTIFLCCSILFMSCDSYLPRVVANDTMKSLYTGDRYGFEISYCVLEDFVAKENREFNPTTDIVLYKKLFFDYPQAIQTYTYLGHYSTVDTLYVARSYSRETYANDSINNSVWGSYEKFADMIKTPREDQVTFTVLEDKNIVKYGKLASIRQFYYRVSTLTGPYKTTVLLVKEHSFLKHRDTWQVAAVFNQPI